MASRPRHEQISEIEKLEEEIKNIAEVEVQQGRSSSPASAYSERSHVSANYEPEIAVSVAEVRRSALLAGVYHPLDVSSFFFSSPTCVV
ncbi:hypothetical protein NMY22_g17392 [Coprinellus aureogranulatus]|nr:hypothetical protein NMY22_g17392 [Coprinellus aureogranulatus]